MSNPDQDSTQGRPEADGSAHELGTGGDQDIVKGPAAGDTARFVRVGTADDPFEADLLADALDEAGVPVLARARRDAVVDTLVVPAAPWWEILVPEEFQQKATEVVAARQGELESDAGAAAQAAVDEEAASEPSLQPPAVEPKPE